MREALFSLRKASFALCIAASLLCSSCHDNDTVFNIDPEGPGAGFCIMPVSMIGEEIPYDSVPGESRAMNAMTVDRENMIKTIAIFQFDKENNLRTLKNGQYYLYHNFTEFGSVTPNGVSLVNIDNMPELAQLLTSTKSDLYTCVIANASEELIQDAILPNGSPVDWPNFKEFSFPLPMATKADVENERDNLEYGHLTSIYMFGYYEGIVPPTGFTLGLGRVVSRIKIKFEAYEDEAEGVGLDKLPSTARFFAAIRNLPRTGYFYTTTETQPQVSTSDVYMLPDQQFNPKSGSAVLQFYCGPQLGSWIAENDQDGKPLRTQLLLWCAVNPDEYEDPNVNWNQYFLEDNIDKAVTIEIGNNPGAGDYGIVHNTVYSYTMGLGYGPSGFVVKPINIFAMVWLDQYNNWAWDGDAAQENVPLTLYIDTRASKHNFEIKKIFNRDWDKRTDYGFVEYLIRNKRDWTQVALKDEVTQDGQIAFDFSTLSYSNLSTDKLLLQGATENDGVYTGLETAGVKLLPLANGTASFDINIPESYAPTINNEASNISSRKVHVTVPLTGVFTHTLTPDANIAALTDDTSVADILVEVGTFTATKKYNGFTVSELTDVEKANLQFTSISGVEGVYYNATTQKIVVPENTNGIAYMHFNIADGNTDTGLTTYKYTDMTLPITIGMGLGGHQLRLVWCVNDGNGQPTYDVAENYGIGDQALKFDLSNNMNKINDNNNKFNLSELFKSDWKIDYLEYVLDGSLSLVDKTNYTLKSSLQYAGDDTKQLLFDFSKVTYSLGQGETKLMLDNTNKRIYPLEAGLAILDLTIPNTDAYDYRNKDNQKLSVDIVNPTVHVEIDINSADLKHDLVGPNDMGSIAVGDNLVDFLTGKQFTATKEYNAQIFNTISGVPYADLEIKSVSGQDGATFDSNNGTINWTSGAISGQIYVHFKVKDNASKTDLTTYKYSDLILPIDIKAPNVHYDFGAVWQVYDSTKPEGQQWSWDNTRAHGSTPLTLNLTAEKVQATNFELEKLFNRDWNQATTYGIVDYILQRNSGTLGQDHFTLASATNLSKNELKFFDQNTNVIWPDPNSFSSDYLLITYDKKLLPVQKPTGSDKATFDIKLPDNYDPNNIDGVAGITIDNRTLHVQVEMPLEIKNELTPNEEITTVPAPGATTSILSILSKNGNTINFTAQKTYGTTTVHHIGNGFNYHYALTIDDVRISGDGITYNSGNKTLSLTNDADGIIEIDVAYNVSDTDQNKYKYPAKLVYTHTIVIGNGGTRTNGRYAIISKSNSSNRGEGSTPYQLSIDSDLNLANLIGNNATNVGHYVVNLDDTSVDPSEYSASALNLAYSSADESKLKISSSGNLIPLVTGENVEFNVTMQTVPAGYIVEPANRTVTVQTNFTGSIDHTLTAQLKSGTTAPTLYEDSDNDIAAILSAYTFSANLTYNNVVVYSSSDLSDFAITSTTSGVSVDNGKVTVAQNSPSTIELTVSCNTSANLRSDYKFENSLTCPLTLTNGGARPASSEIPIWPLNDEEPFTINNNYLEIDASVWDNANLKGGDSVVISLINNGGGQITYQSEFHYSWGLQWEWLDNSLNNYNLASNADSDVLLLSEDIANQLKIGGLRISGQNITISSVKVIPASN